MSGLTAYAFFPPPSIRPSIVNQSSRNASSRTFCSIHFHRLAYTESQATASDALSYPAPNNNPAQESGILLPSAKDTQETAGVETISEEALHQWHSPSGYGLPDVKSDHEVNRELAEDIHLHESSCDLIAVQTGRQSRLPCAFDTSLPHVTLAAPPILSRKRKLLVDSVPDSTRKEAKALRGNARSLLSHFADEVVDTPQQHQPRNPLKVLHPSPSTPLNRGASAGMLLVRETEKRVRMRSKPGSNGTSVDPETPDVALQEKRVRHMPDAFGRDSKRRNRNQTLETDTSLELRGTSFPVHELGRSAGQGIVTSTQKDATHLHHSFFSLGNETTANWPAPILSKPDSCRSGSLGDLSPEVKDLASRSSALRCEPPITRFRAQTVPIAAPLDLSFSTDDSKSVSQPGTRAATESRNTTMSSTHNSAAQNRMTRQPEEGANTTDWFDSWEATPTGKERMVSEAERTSETLSGRMTTRTASGRSADIGQIILTGSTESDLFTQTLNTAEKSGSGLFTSQSQSICTFPSYLTIPVNTLTDLAELLNMPVNRESRRVNVLAVVWEVGQMERYSERCEVQLCQPVDDDVSEWGMRKTLLRVEFWDEFAQDVKRLKSGDVVWMRNLDHKSKADKESAYRGRPRYMSTVSSRRSGSSYPTSITIMYRAMPDRYIHRGPSDRCQECAAAVAIRDVVRHEDLKEGEDTDAVCQRHKGEITIEDNEYRLDRRLLESEIGMRRVKKLVEWVESTFTPRAGYQADKYRLNANS